LGYLKGVKEVIIVKVHNGGLGCSGYRRRRRNRNTAAALDLPID
jgi:hypothetical protein